MKYENLCGLVALLVLQGLLLTFANTSTNSIPYWLHFFVIGGAAALLRPNISVPRWFAMAVLCALPIALPEVRRDLGWAV